MDDSPLVGVLRSWKDAWGFIVCPDAFEGDLFAHKESFVGPFPQGNLSGASVQFRRDVDAKGRPRAVDITVLEMGEPGAGAPQAPRQQSQARIRRPSGPMPPQTPPPSFWGQGFQAPGFGAPGFRAPGFGAPGFQAMGFQAQGSTRANPAKLQQLVGTRLRGKVRSWKEQWGFLTSTKFEGDVFVHKQNVQIGGEPVAGMPVSFSIAIDQNGRACAVEVTEPAPAPEDFEGAGQLTGQIRSWKNEWGFIVAPEHFEGDLFCHKEHVHVDVPPAELAQAVVSKAVSFEVMSDSKGRICATKVVLLDPFQSPAMPAIGSRSAAVAAMPAIGSRTGGRAPKKEASAPVELLDGGEVLTGTLRSWRDPWGFIVCPERFEGDLFVHKEVFQGEQPNSLSAGRQVQFQRAMDARGRAHAIEVRMQGKAPRAAIANGLSAQAGPGPAPSVQNAAKYEHCMGMTVNGACRSWKGEWGFVVSDSFEGDLFAHKMHLASGAEFLTPGAALTFEVGGDSRGRATALNVQVVSEAKDWIGTGQQLQGTIRSFREAWGFLVSPGSYTGDLFFHVEQVHPVTRPMLQTGLEVVFSVDMGSKDRVTGVNIQHAPMPMLGLGPSAKRKAPSTPVPMQGFAKMMRF